MSNFEWDTQIPKTIAERVVKIASVYTHAKIQLKHTFELNRYGNMVERYGRNLPAYTRALNNFSADFDNITTGIYEGKKGSDLL